MNSSMGGGGRHLGGGTMALHTHKNGGRGEICRAVKRGIVEIFKCLGGGPNFFHKSKKGNEISMRYMRMSSTPSPQLISDPSLTSSFFNFRSLKN